MTLGGILSEKWLAIIDRVHNSSRFLCNMKPTIPCHVVLLKQEVVQDVSYSTFFRFQTMT